MTTYAASDLTSKPKTMGEWGDMVLAEGKVALTALANADVIRPCVIPAGYEVHAIILANDGLDSNGVPTAAFEIGYNPVSSNDGSLAQSAAYFAAAGDTTIRAANVGKVYAKFDPKKFDQDAFLEITMTAAIATFAAGSVYVKVIGRAVGIK